MTGTSHDDRPLKYHGDGEVPQFGLNAKQTPEKPFEWYFKLRLRMYDTPARMLSGNREMVLLQRQRWCGVNRATLFVAATNEYYFMRWNFLLGGDISN